MTDALGVANLRNRSVDFLNYLKKRTTEREGNANAPSERTDGAAYGENSKEPELSLVCPFRFFFIHPVLPADFRQAYRTLSFS